MDNAILAVLKEFEKQGVKIEEIEVKLFGGSELFKKSGGSSNMRVGKLNIEKAMKLLEEKKIKIIASDVGGPVGRKILFYSHTGEVFVKLLRNMNNIDP
jgi:chemotaxis protein CheD